MAHGASLENAGLQTQPSGEDAFTTSRPININDRKGLTSLCRTPSVPCTRDNPFYIRAQKQRALMSSFIPQKIQARAV